MSALAEGVRRPGVFKRLLEQAGRSETLSKPSILKLVIFAFPALPHAFVALPLNIVIPAFYALHTRVTLGEIAAVTTLTRLFDAVTDPLAGYLSDRTRSPIGRRKPWVLAASVLCAVGIFFTFRPPANADYIYFATWSFVLYLGFTLFEIPRGAWGAELSRDYRQRSRINTWVSVFNVAGSAVFWLLPLLLMGITGTTAITGATLAAIAWLYLLLMPAGVLLAIVAVPEGERLSTTLSTFRDLFRSLRTNRPLWSYFAVIGLWGLGQGALLSTIFIFIGDYLRLGASFPFMMLGYFIVQIAALPFWMKLSDRVGRHRVWAVSLAVDACLRPLILFFHPGSAAIVPVSCLIGLSAFLTASNNFAPSSILGDVIDYDILKSRVNKAANFFALNTLLIKAVMALGSGAVLAALGIFGYAIGKPNTPAATLGLIVCYLVFPGIAHISAGICAWWLPLTRARHAIIQRRLERRSKGMSR